MRKFILAALLSSLTLSCSYLHVHQMEVEQGNIISSEQVSRLHVGMTDKQVNAILGKPLLIDIYGDNRSDYVYTFQIGSLKRTEKRVTLVFKGHVLQSIERWATPQKR